MPELLPPQGLLAELNRATERVQADWRRATQQSTAATRAVLRGSQRLSRTDATRDLGHSIRALEAQLISCHSFGIPWPQHVGVGKVIRRLIADGCPKMTEDTPPRGCALDPLRYMINQLAIEWLRHPDTKPEDIDSVLDDACRHDGPLNRSFVRDIPLLPTSTPEQWHRMWGSRLSTQSYWMVEDLFEIAGTSSESEQCLPRMLVRKGLSQWMTDRMISDIREYRARVVQSPNPLFQQESTMLFCISRLSEVFALLPAPAREKFLRLCGEIGFFSPRLEQCIKDFPSLMHDVSASTLRALLLSPTPRVREIGIRLISIRQLALNEGSLHSESVTEQSVLAEDVASLPSTDVELSKLDITGTSVHHRQSKFVR